MRLSDLLHAEGPESGSSSYRSIEILGISADSRQVGPGYLFAALPGYEADGQDFIDDAIDHGAVAVLAPPGADGKIRRAHDADFEIVTDLNPRRKLAHMVARFYGRQPATIAAVTGTNGKSSVASFTRQIWQALGNRAASLGTIGLTAPGIKRAMDRTTPDPVTLHCLFGELLDKGIDHLILEASSHGLQQYRLDGVRVTIAAFTNLTRDHLDYHRDAEEYLFAKMRLFGEVMAPGGTVVLNSDDSAFSEIEALCWGRGHKIITVGRGNADLCLASQRATGNGQRMELAYMGETRTINLDLIGEFQALNVLTAAGLAIASGCGAGETFDILPKLKGARGRVELVAKHPSGASIYVDYAHTPDALDNLLTALRPFTEKRLVVVFGCGGDRDVGKRSEMGRIAAAKADLVIVTDDNPRNENPESIRRLVLAGAPGAAEIGDRSQAIKTAVTGLAKGDVLVIAGKGHEKGQIVGGVFNPFDDAEAARKAVAAITGGGNDG